MSILITLGNLNQFTFANSIVAANEKSKQLFGKPLDRVEVFHSEESEKEIQKLRLDNSQNTWVSALKSNRIKEKIVRHRIIGIDSTKESVEEFVVNLEEIVSNATSKNYDLLLDLTNGTTLSKNLLSTAAYVLDIPHQYMIDIGKLFKITKDRGFIDAKFLNSSYVSTPDSTNLDNIAYLSLSEVLRYKRIIEAHSNKFEGIAGQAADTKFFSGNLDKSIRLKLEGDQRKDNTVYRIAAASISSSAEDLISHLIDRFASDIEARMLGEKISAIRTKVEEKAPTDFDIEFFRKFNDFILYLRNSSTHKGRFLTNIEKFKAELAVKMAFPFIEFYTDIIYGILAEDQIDSQPKKIEDLGDSLPKAGQTMYYGLDGDDTGKVLEELFFAEKKPQHFRKISNSIKRAIAQIRNIITKKSGKNAIIFEAGDDLLFTGQYSRQELEAFQGIYNSETSGLTCSIGYGSSLHDVYLALKLAKTCPNKGVIKGAKYY